MISCESQIKTDENMWKPNATQYKSPIKLVGEKSKLIPKLFKRFPTRINRYIEPFCGGGSVFIELLSRIDAGEILTFETYEFIISDINEILIDMFRRIQSDGPQLVAELKKSLRELGNTKSEYLERQIRFNESPNVVDFIILNHQGLHQLWKLKTGSINVPYGNYKNILIDYSGLINLSDLLNKYRVKFFCASYTEILDKYANNDIGQFIYLDPPYYNPILSSTNNKFNYDEYVERLRALYSTPGLYVVSFNSPKFKDRIAFPSFTEYLFRKDVINQNLPGYDAQKIVLTSLTDVSVIKILNRCTELTYDNPVLVDWISFGPLFKYINSRGNMFKTAEAMWIKKLIQSGRKRV